MNHTKIASEGRKEKLKLIAEGILSRYKCRVISQPSPGMIMIKHVDPVERTPFFLGEAYVTQCEVELDDKIGYGCVLGDDPERALYGAIIDASIGNSLALARETYSLLEEEENYINGTWEKFSRQISKTKVNFDVKKG